MKRRTWILLLCVGAVLVSAGLLLRAPAPPSRVNFSFLGSVEPSVYREQVVSSLSGSLTGVRHHAQKMIQETYWIKPTSTEEFLKNAEVELAQKGTKMPYRFGLHYEFGNRTSLTIQDGLQTNPPVPGALQVEVLRYEELSPLESLAHRLSGSKS